MKRKGGRGGLAGLISVLVLSLAACGGNYSTTSGVGSDTAGNGVVGTGVSNFNTTPDKLGVGDLMLVDLSSGSSEAISFEKVDTSAKFILAVGSYNDTGASSSVQVSASLSAASASIAADMAKADVLEGDGSNDGYDANAIMSAWLRASEEALDAEEVRAEPQGMKASMLSSVKSAAVGGAESFRVLSSLASVNSYVDVTANIRCVTDSAVIYVDASVPADLVSDADVSQLCHDFDVTGEEAIIGQTSDVDGDGRFHVLMTSQINKLGALGGGVITGYFYAGDLYERSSSNAVSNHREIIYTMVPDPNGVYGMQIQKDFAMHNLLPAVLPHELQHAISYNQHVFVKGGSPEENWLNEGLSHLMEDRMGWNVENPSRVAVYLASPSTYGVVTPYSPNLMERGASYLFLRYLYEQASDGDKFLAALETSSSRGIKNIESSFNGLPGMDKFSDFIIHWVAAVAMSDRGITNDSRFVYSPRTVDSVTGNMDGICLSCDAEDGRGTKLAGVHLNSFLGQHNVTVDGGTAKYFDVQSVPESMTFAPSGDASNFALLIRYQ